MSVSLSGGLFRRFIGRVSAVSLPALGVALLLALTTFADEKKSAPGPRHLPVQLRRPRPQAVPKPKPTPSNTSASLATNGVFRWRWKHRSSPFAVPNASLG